MVAPQATTKTTVRALGFCSGLAEEHVNQSLDVTAVDLRVAVDVIQPAGGALAGDHIANKRG